MAKRILVTSTDLMMVQFLVPHVIHLSDNGYEVEIACSDVGGRMSEIRKKLKGYTISIHTVSLVRSPISFANIKGYRDLTKIIRNGNYDIIWTNEPVMGVVTRLSARNARKQGTKLIYMVHGFHFFNGAPKLNWIIYYPIEKIMASKADIICTVNHEDYRRAQSFNVKRVEYIHGIGINTSRLTLGKEQGNIRRELGLTDEHFLVLSVGELNANKNQKVILEALSELGDKSIHYLLCGKGDQLEKLKEMTGKLGLNKNVHFLGYRQDVVDICSQADVFVMPSKREGLPVASLEAMYCGLPLVTSNIRGLVDVMENGVSGYLCEPDDVAAFAKGIKKIKQDPGKRKQMGARNREAVRAYQISKTMDEVLAIMNSL